VGWALLVGGSVTSYATASFAQGAEGENDPRYHSERGYEEFQLGNFAEAAALFEVSYRMRPSARVLRAIAKCQFELRHYTRAIDFAERALAEKEEPLSPELETDARALRDRARAFVVDAEFDVSPPEASVVVDGQTVTPRVRLDVGTHSVHVSASGYASMTSSVAVQSDAQTRWTFHLVPLGASPVAEVREARPSILFPATIGGIALVGTGIAAAFWIDRNAAVVSCNDSVAGCENIGSLRGERTFAAVGTLAGGAIVLGSAYFLTRALFSSPKQEIAIRR